MVSLLSCAPQPPHYVTYQVVHPMVYQLPSTHYTLLGILVNNIGNLVTTGTSGNQDRQDSEDPRVKPEDVQAIWISGFPIRRTVQL